MKLSFILTNNNIQIEHCFCSGAASVDSSSPPAPSSGQSTNTPTIIAPTMAQAPPIQTTSVVAAAAFVHLNNGYLDTTPQRNSYVSFWKPW